MVWGNQRQTKAGENALVTPNIYADELVIKKRSCPEYLDNYIQQHILVSKYTNVWDM